MHLLSFLDPTDRFLSTDHIDQVISAEIPVSMNAITMIL